MVTIYAGIGATEQTAAHQIGVSGGGGGGEGTAIPDGGTLSGDYEGNVLCLGAVTTSGNVTVKGNLIVLGEFTNSGGYDLTVKGDLNARLMSFTNGNPSMPAGDISVDGDFWFYVLDYVQTGGVAKTLRVGGDLIGSSGYSEGVILAYGANDNDGATLHVYGDVKCHYLYLSGGNSSSGVAGHGGNLTVWGNAEVSYYAYLNGGDSYNTGFDAGNGGQVEVYGDFTVEGLYSYGGNGIGSTSGEGGSVYVYGNLTTTEIQLYGGYCNSNSEAHRTGSGGRIEIYSNLVCHGTVDVSAGNRGGTVSSPNPQPSANGGDLEVHGTTTIYNSVYMGGGSVFTNLDVGPGGYGGSAYLYGGATLNDSFECYGGDSSASSGGNSGSLYCKGHLVIAYQAVMHGGNGGSGEGGYGGSLYADSSADLSYLNLDGGSGTNGHGRQAGDINVRGHLTHVDYLSLQGGSCDSTNENHEAGAGGNLNVLGSASFYSAIYLNGGNRYGATTISNPGASSPNGGAIAVAGNLTMQYAELSGGSVSTDYPNAAGGNGGSLRVTGSLSMVDIFGEGFSNELILHGGNSVGNNGGNAGSLFIGGFATLVSLYAHGGDANNSVLGADAGVNGQGPDSVGFPAGVSVLGGCELQDGTGPGSIPTGNMRLILGGFCTFGILNMGNRPEAAILSGSQTVAAIPCTLKIGSMPAKNTLNNADNSATGSISASLGDSIFTSDNNGWYKITGTGI